MRIADRGVQGMKPEGRAKGRHWRELMVRRHHGLQGRALHEPARHGSQNPAKIKIVYHTNSYLSMLSDRVGLKVFSHSCELCLPSALLSDYSLKNYQRKVVLDHRFY